MHDGGKHIHFGQISGFGTAAPCHTSGSTLRVLATISACLSVSKVTRVEYLNGCNGASAEVLPCKSYR